MLPDFVLGVPRRDWARLEWCIFLETVKNHFSYTFWEPHTKYLFGPLKLQVIESQSKPLSTTR